MAKTARILRRKVRHPSTRGPVFGPLETVDTSRPARPLVWLAGTLGMGTFLGLTAGEGAGPAASAAAAGLALAAFLLARRGIAPAWTIGVLLLASVRACGLDATPAPGSIWNPGSVRNAGRALTAVAARDLRAEPIVGRWHAERDGRTGWVEPFDACVSAECSARHALLFEPECGTPANGTPVAILPGSEVVPWPRGPEAVPQPRSRTFAGFSPVAVDELVRLGPPPRTFWSTPIEALLRELRALRVAVGVRVGRVERESSAGLLRALVIGARDGMPAERIDLFARTGTSHLLAISGWHVGLFAALVVLPLARVTPRARRSLLGLAARGALLLLFAAVAGAEKPVLRATLALVLLQLAVLRARSSSAPPRRPDGLSFLAAAFALECLLDPAGIRTLSLSLSYAATLGLILGTGVLGRGLRPTREPWAELAPARWLRVLAGRCIAWLASGLAASAAAVLATLPLTWSAFGEFAPAGALLTLLALVPFTFLSLLAWLAALLPWSGLAGPAELGARALYALLEFGDALPGTPLLLPPRPFAALLLATALVFLGLRHAGSLSGVARRAAALAWGLCLLPWSAAPRGLELHMLDVGHGSALVLRAPGLEALVFDAGSRDRRGLAREALLPLLARWEVAQASVLLSHPDHDHASGLARLSERVRIARWLGAEPAQGPVRLPHDALEIDLAQGRLHVGAPCPELSLALLRGSEARGNEGSRALEVTWRSERLVLLGDAEEAGLEDLPLASGPLRLILAPHHGSDAPAFGALLERCPPAEVWISASGEPPIARELARRGIEWCWSGRDGPVALCLP